MVSKHSSFKGNVNLFSKVVTPIHAFMCSLHKILLLGTLSFCMCAGDGLESGEEGRVGGAGAGSGGPHLAWLVPGEECG